jgi:hypothetical protein
MRKGTPKKQTMPTIADRVFDNPYVLVASLPGPTRKRLASRYCYHLTYRNPDPRAVGCSLLWEVHGGRLTYQIALEREETGRLTWHCTCADAVYRGELVENHCCKHVRGLTAQGRACPTVALTPP